MKIRTLSIFLLLAIATSLFGEEEIVVPLSAQSELSPLFLDTFANNSAGFDKSYLAQLEKVLRFDLDHNGRTAVLAQTQPYLSHVAREKGWKSFDRNGWQNLHTTYVVKAMVSDHKLSTSIYLVQDNLIKTIEGMTLSGSLSEDRGKIHHLADAIHEALFNTRGIASTHMLYTLRKKVGESSATWQTEVWEADYDGNNKRQITREGHLCVTPAYLPTKLGGRCSHFLYVSYRIGQPKIYIASLREGSSKRLTYLRGNQLMPSISPQKDMIAFISDITGNPELFIQPVDMEQRTVGKPFQIFSAPSAAQGSPTFCPDGKEIAFVSNKDGSPRIYIMPIPDYGSSVKDLKPRLITKQNRDNTSPAWSPDGHKIAYCALTRGVRQIWIYDFDTNKESQLTEGNEHKENPSWGPDGVHLLYNSSTKNAAEIYLINLNQKEAVKISSGPGEKGFPSWEA